jgi:hypothetical protein
MVPNHSQSADWTAFASRYVELRIFIHISFLQVRSFSSLYHSGMKSAVALSYRENWMRQQVFPQADR